MSGPTRRAGWAWALGLVGALLLGGGAACLLAPAREGASPAPGVGQALRRLEDDLAARVRDLDKVLEEAARRLAGTDPFEPPEKATEAEAERAEAAAYLAPLASALATAAVPGDVLLTFYDGAAGSTRVLGRVSKARTQVLEEVDPAGRLRSAAVESLVRPSPLTGWVLPSPRWVWFERGQGPSGVRLVRADVLHEFSVAVEQDGSDPELIEGVFLLCAALEVALPVGADVRCDVVDGAVERAALPWARGPGAADGDLEEREALVMLPGGHAWPSAQPGPRGVLRAPRAAAGDGRAPWVALLVAGGVLLAVAFALRALRPVEASVTAPDVTAEAAHEMRTPLTAMRGALEVALRRERSPAEYQETLHLCLDEVKGLQNLQDAVLFLGRGARVEPAREPVDLLALVEGEVARVKGAHVEREIALDAGRGPFTLTGDPSLLARLVGNLLDNAALHSTPGGAIRVALAREGARVVVTVEDDGPGVPEARRERIFERFYRGPESSRRGIPGSGLGLPIARWLAEIHGGTLALDPQPTDRARFRLVLPADAS